LLDLSVDPAASRFLGRNRLARPRADDGLSKQSPARIHTGSMKRFLSTLVVLEGLVLLVAALGFAFAGEGLRARPARPHVFRPQILDAVIGERARYRILDARTGELLGFATYHVRVAEEIEQMVGRRFLVEIVIESADGGRQTRILRVDPRTQGWLPPLPREDALPPGEWPVIRTIESEPVQVKRAGKDGFRVEAVRPRWGLAEVQDVYWLSDAVPVFGLVRRESRKGIPHWFEGRPVIWELNDFQFPEGR
jgi:hypothetical protein